MAHWLSEECSCSIDAWPPGSQSQPPTVFGSIPFKFFLPQPRRRGGIKLRFRSVWPRVAPS